MASAVTINKKVPGKVLALGKLGDEAKKFEQEIRKKTPTELVDILNRQNAILQNPKLLESLPDKGEKVRKRQQHIQELIERSEKTNVDETVNMINGMTITSKSTRVDTNKMEWKFGGANLMNQYDSMKKLDSDDESDNDIDPQEYLQNNPEFMKNPLKILASRSEVPNHKKSHASYIAEVEKATIDKGKDDLDSRFVPFNSLRNESLSEENVLSIRKSLSRKSVQNTKKLESMPLPSNNYSNLKAKNIDLSESITLQKDQAAKLKEIQSKQAADRLAQSNLNTHMQEPPLMPLNDKMGYRDSNIANEICDSNDNTSDDSANDYDNEEGVRITFTQDEYVQHE